MNKNSTSISDKELAVLDSFLFIPVLIVSKSKVLFVSKGFLHSFWTDIDTNSISINDIFYYKKIQQKVQNSIDSHNQFNMYEVRLKAGSNRRIYVNVYANIVVFNNEECMLLQFTDVTENVIAKNKLVAMTKARNLMLKVTENILNYDNINDIFKLILNTAIKVYNHNYIGSIMTKSDEYYRIVACVGYEDVDRFRIKEEDTILYKASGGKMNRTVIINNLSDIDSFVPLSTIYGKSQYIKSTLAAPIIIKGKVFGVISIDSIHINAFSMDDINIMKFLKSSTEIAISNYLLYNSKVFYANHDSLTKLYNRVYFERHFNSLKKKALQENKDIVIVMVDVNHLKIVNDTYGHNIGDTVLNHIAKNIMDIIGENEIAARIGGDEFAILFYGRSYSDIDCVLNNILENKSKEIIKINDIEEEVNCSFCYGTSSYLNSKNIRSLKDLIKQADDNMYKSKAQRNERA